MHAQRMMYRKSIWGARTRVRSFSLSMSAWTSNIFCSFKSISISWKLHEPDNIHTREMEMEMEKDQNERSKLWTVFLLLCITHSVILSTLSRLQYAEYESEYTMYARVTFGTPICSIFIYPSNANECYAAFVLLMLFCALRSSSRDLEQYVCMRV